MAVEINEKVFLGVPSVSLGNFAVFENQYIIIERAGMESYEHAPIYMYVGETSGFYTLEEIDTLIASLMVVRQGVADST